MRIQQFKAGLIAGAAVLAIGAPAHAELKQLTISGNLTGVFGHTEAPANYFSGDFTNAAQSWLSHNTAGDGSFSFTVQYDTDEVGVNGYFAATLIDGHAGTNTFADFSGFTAQILQINVPNPSIPSQLRDRIDIILTKVDDQAGNYSRSRSIDVDLVDFTGTLFGDKNTLFTTLSGFTFSERDLEYRLNGANGDYLGRTYSGGIGLPSLADAPAPETGPGGGVTGGIPEPTAWALMILGFGGAGAMLRARRRAAA